jgi:hypothetical protein
MPILNAPILAVKWGAQDIAAVYYGPDKIWPAGPPPATLKIGGAINTLETMFGPSYTAHVRFAFTPAGDTGEVAEWVNEDGNKVAVVEGQLVVLAAASNADIAAQGGMFLPLVAHNGHWWKITPTAGGWNFLRNSGINLQSNEFKGFYTATQADHQNEMRHIAADAFEDESYGFYVDPAANTITIFARPAGLGDMHGSPAPSRTIHLTLPPGMTGSDLVYPLGTRS